MRYRSFWHTYALYEISYNLRNYFLFVSKVCLHERLNVLHFSYDGVWTADANKYRLFLVGYFRLYQKFMISDRFFLTTECFSRLFVQEVIPMVCVQCFTIFYLFYFFSFIFLAWPTLIWYCHILCCEIYFFCAKIMCLNFPMFHSDFLIPLL